MRDKALEYAHLACSTMMNKFEAPQLPPVYGFHYHAGVFLSGMMKLYEVCGDEKYLQYTKDWVDSVIVEDGVIRFAKGSIDDYMAGILLFPLYERFEEKRYMTVLLLFKTIIRNWLCNEKGGFWHKEWYPDQMWLDGLYMAGPLQAMFTQYFNEPYFLDNAAKQAIIMYENMQDEKTKLLYHGWDCSRVVGWADKETGLSKEFWGRALGWYVVAMLDILELMPKNHPSYEKLIAIEKEVLEAVISYQCPKSGMWYQLIDKGEDPRNWIETSCSCLFVYATAKAMRMNIIDKKYMAVVKRGFEGILSHSVKQQDGKIILDGTCIGTSVCEYEEYITRPTNENDLHGMGAFLLMCVELVKIKE